MHLRNATINSSNALEQGREAFAVPGVAQSTRSRGAHKLIREGAKLCESAEDVLEEIRPLIRPAHRSLDPVSGAQDGLSSPPHHSGVVTPEVSNPGRNPVIIGRGEFEIPGSPEETVLLRILDKVP